MFINLFGLSDSVIYQTKYTNTYQNKEDTFTLNIYRTLYTTDTSDDTFQTVIPVEMFASLKYKDAKDFLEPIRGASLDIKINSSIENPYSEFLSFNEYDYAVEFIRNNDIIFEGYINPEGITQSFSSPNWQAQLIAVDNLGTLKNIEFEPGKTLPSENQILLKIFRKTKLWLPICYADDINVKAITKGGNITNLFQEFWRDDQRVINPDVFINSNDRGVDCLTVLKDILTKYNACLILQNMRLRDQNDNYVENRLCWVFFRPEFMYSNLKTYQQGYKVIDYSFTVNHDNIDPFGSVEKYNIQNEYYTRNNYNAIYSDVEVPYPRPSYFSQNIHVNSNQEIRARNTLQNFRFEQKWVKIPTLFKYKYDFFTPKDIIDIYGSPTSPPLYENTNDKLGFFSTPFEPSISGSPAVDILYESNEIDLPKDADDLEISGLLEVTNLVGQSLDFDGELFYTFIHKRKDGAYIQFGLDFDNSGSLTGASWQGQIANYSAVELKQVNHARMFTTNLKNLLTDDKSKFDTKLPKLTSKGGKLKIFISAFYARPADGSSPVTSQMRKFFIEILDLKVKALEPKSLGKGIFHDAERKDKASTKLEDPVKIINADTDTELFANGLQKRIEVTPNNFELANYRFWSTRSRLTVLGDIENYKKNLLEVMSIERLRLRNAPRLLFSGDIYGYISYTAIVNYIFFGAKRFAIISYNYNTIENVTSITAMEIESGASDSNYSYENSIIFDEEKNKLINE